MSLLCRIFGHAPQDLTHIQIDRLSGPQRHYGVRANWCYYYATCRRCLEHYEHRTILQGVANTYILRLESENGALKRTNLELWKACTSYSTQKPAGEP